MVADIRHGSYEQIFGVNEQIPEQKVSATRAFVQKMHSDIP
jgi:hypothetical protein